MWVVDMKWKSVWDEVPTELSGKQSPRDLAEWYC